MKVPDPNQAWIALQVRPKMERTTAQHLDYRGYECFLPLRSDGPSQRGGDAPLFPGYVFCRYEETASAPIVTTPGVTRIVSFGGRPAYVDSDEIIAIRRALETAQVVRPMNSFRPGTSVVIEDGPLQGVRGTVVGMDDKQYLIVSVSLLRRSIAIELDPSWVRIEKPDVRYRM